MTSTRRVRLKSVAALAAAVGISGFAFKLLIDAGAFRTIEKHSALPACQTIQGQEFRGTEDVEISIDGWVFMSSDPRDGAHEGVGAPGSLHVLNLGETGSQPKLVPHPLGEEFHPHGISLSPSGNRLFVVNHRSHGDSIEVFARRGGALAHERTILAPSNGNDVAAVDDERFYLTRDHAAETAIGKSLEDYSRIGRGSVEYFDGSGFVTVATRISYANGVLASSDGRSIWVGAMLERQVREYARDPATGALKARREIAMGFGVDNLNRTSDGSILVAGHPKLLKVSKMRRDRSTRSPSEIVRMQSEGTAVIQPVMTDPGDEIAASSVAAEWRGRWIVGSVFDDRILICRPYQAAGQAAEQGGKTSHR